MPTPPECPGRDTAGGGPGDSAQKPRQQHPPRVHSPLRRKAAHTRGVLEAVQVWNTRPPTQPKPKKHCRRTLGVLEAVQLSEHPPSHTAKGQRSTAGAPLASLRWSSSRNTSLGTTTDTTTAKLEAAWPAAPPPARRACSTAQRTHPFALEPPPTARGETPRNRLRHRLHDGRQDAGAGMPPLLLQGFAPPPRRTFGEKCSCMARSSRWPVGWHRKLVSTTQHTCTPAAAAAPPAPCAPAPPSHRL